MTGAASVTVCATVLCMALSVSARADQICDDLWFSRNAIFDGGGYCFGSALGQATFDNSDCTGKDPLLTADDKALIADIADMEAELGCAIDTSRVRLEIPDLAVRQTLVHQPLRDQSESGCLGWTGPPTTLHAGTSTETSAVGRIMPGDYILFAHRHNPGASYVTVHAHDYTHFKGAGWLIHRADALPCVDFAG